MCHFPAHKACIAGAGSGEVPMRQADSPMAGGGDMEQPAVARGRGCLGAGRQGKGAHVNWSRVHSLWLWPFQYSVYRNHLYAVLCTQ